MTEAADWGYYFGYMLLSNSFIAVPHEPLVFLYGKMYGIWCPTFLSILPTLMGAYLDYLFLYPLFQTGYAGKIKETKIYTRLMRYFEISPFATLAIVAATPVPFYPLRILSVASEYPAQKYMLSVLIGRLPRYALIAAGGAMLQISDQFILVLFITLISWYILSAIRNIRKNKKGKTNVS